MKIKLIKDDGLSRRYRLIDNREVIISIDEMDNKVFVTTPDGRDVGHVELSQQEDERCINYKITWMYLDRLDETYKRQGIGRECLKFFNEIMGEPIIAENHDGIRKDDGSHLTQDAPGFVSKMREEGVIEDTRHNSEGWPGQES